MVAALEARLADLSGAAALVRPNAALRNEALAVFDRAFAITGALQLLAAAVAFVGVLSALFSLQLERARELGVLRAIGLTVGQLRGAVLLETGLMGAVAGLLAIPTGLTLALALIYIINRRSFGWTLELHAEPGVFIQALLLAVAAALLTGVYPAIRMGRMLAAEALRGGMICRACRSRAANPFNQSRCAGGCALTRALPVTTGDRRAELVW